MEEKNPFRVINTILLVVLIVVATIAIFRSYQSDSQPTQENAPDESIQTDTDPLVIEPPRQPISEEQEDLSVYVYIAFSAPRRTACCVPYLGPTHLYYGSNPGFGKSFPYFG